jgi:hypothetical protein
VEAEELDDADAVALELAEDDPSDALARLEVYCEKSGKVIFVSTYGCVWLIATAMGTICVKVDLIVGYHLTISDIV